MRGIRLPFVGYTSVYTMAMVAFLGCTQVGNHQKKEKDVDLSEKLSPESVVLPDSLTVESYLNWVKDPHNGHVFAKNVKDQECSVFYRPTMYDVLTSLRSSEYQAQKIKELYALKAEDLMLSLDITPKITSTKQLVGTVGNTGGLEYENYDPLFIAGKDTLHKSFIHLEYGLSGQKRYYLIYKRPQKWDENGFVHAELLWNTPEANVKAYFLKKILDYSPKIKYNENF